MKDVLLFSSFEKVLESLNSSPYRDEIESIFVIGGYQIYEESLKYKQYLDSIYLTKIYHDIPCDTYFKINLNDYNENVISSKKVTNNENKYEIEIVKLIPKNSQNN